MIWRILDAIAHRLYTPTLRGQASRTRWHHHIHLIPRSWLTYPCNRYEHLLLDGGGKRLMAIAVHHDGPADDKRIPVEGLTQVRYHATEATRAGSGWIPLARYVFTPPQRNAAGTLPGKFRDYTYTGVEQRKGPVPGDKDQPEWST
jgi:hypothetical protein